MLLIRPLIAKKFLPKQGKLSIYAALYFYPILALLHAVGGGLICMSCAHCICYYKIDREDDIYTNCVLITHIVSLCRLLISIYHYNLVGSVKCGAFCV